MCISFTGKHNTYDVPFERANNNSVTNNLFAKDIQTFSIAIILKGQESFHEHLNEQTKII